ncbi:MAG: S-layer homology domain-containing protein [Andreesenia angusta]|nr:S-layer homology domain-containing protein [Andreesenia angusta]
MSKIIKRILLLFLFISFISIIRGEVSNANKLGHFIKSEYSYTDEKGVKQVLDIEIIDDSIRAKAWEEVNTGNVMTNSNNWIFVSFDQDINQGQTVVFGKVLTLDMKYHYAFMECDGKGSIRVTHFDDNKMVSNTRTYKFISFDLISKEDKSDSEIVNNFLNLDYDIVLDKIIEDKDYETNLMTQYNLINEHYGDPNAPYLDGIFDEIKALMYEDVSLESWYYEAIDTLSMMEIVNGREIGKFYPDDNITRAEFVTILSRVSGENISEYYDANIFDDISNNTIWYKANANWAYINGIAVGYNGRFDGDRNITREEMSKMVTNYIKSYNVNIRESDYQKYFHDENEIAPWAYDSVMFLANHEILNGMGDGRFAPKENTSRAQAAQIIYNFIRFN